MNWLKGSIRLTGIKLGEYFMPITVKNRTRLGMNYKHPKIDLEMQELVRGYIASGEFNDIAPPASPKPN